MRKQSSLGWTNNFGAYKAVVLGLIVGSILGITFISSVEKVHTQSNRIASQILSNLDPGHLIYIYSKQENASACLIKVPSD